MRLIPDPPGKIIDGEIKFKDEDITNISTDLIVKMGAVLIPEGRGIFPNLTVQENLNLGAFTREDKEEITKDQE